MSDRVTEVMSGRGSIPNLAGPSTLAGRKAEITRGSESKFQEASDEYDAAHANYLESAGTTRAATSDRNTAAASALAGLAILTLADTTVVGGLAFIVAVGCGTLALLRQLALVEARAKCQAAIQKMYVEYRITKKERDSADCPSRPDQICM